jgi:hypothetical protein
LDQLEQIGYHLALQNYTNWCTGWCHQRKIGFLIPSYNQVRGAAGGATGTGPDLEEDMPEVSGGAGAEADIAGLLVQAAH